MANPQKKQGHLRIANDIWDEIIRRDFKKRHKDILQFILRLSYGCNQKTAVVPTLKDFALCGVGKTHITKELGFLEKCKVIYWNRETNEFQFNKNYDVWEIKLVKEWDTERFKEILHINIKTSQNRNLSVTETVTDEPLKQEEDSYQNGNFEEEKQLPNQKLPVTESVTASYRISNFEEENSYRNGNLPVTEKVTDTPREPNRDKASKPPKDSLKPLVIKDSLKTTSRHPKTYAEDNLYFIIASYLHKKIMEYAEGIKVGHLVRGANLQKWADECRKLIELDKRDKDEVRRIIEWTSTNGFWQRQILSPTNLRKKYVRLCMEMTAKKHQNSKNNKTEEREELLKKLREEDQNDKNRGV